jgi:hypothetical protein
MTKFWVIFMLLLLGMYFVLLGGAGIALLQTGQPIAVAMGLFLFVIPAVAAWGITLEIRFGIQAEKMAKQVESEGRWPLLNFELHPSGRPVKASALVVFEKIKAESEANPEDWHSWFNLGMSYDSCGDRKRARASLRKALSMKKAAGQ